MLSPGPIVRELRVKVLGASRLQTSWYYPIELAMLYKIQLV